jgi:hypothetical protein
MPRSKKISLREKLIQEAEGCITNKGFYTPSLEDFKLNAKYQERWVTITDGWLDNKIDSESFKITQDSCEFISILKRFKLSKETFRIKYLSDSCLTHNDFMKRIIDGVYEDYDIIVTLDWSKEHNVSIYKKEELVFNGYISNKLELINILNKIK